jgi:two-component system response regulator RegA
MKTETETLPSLLLVDDDETFCNVMARALHRRGFEVAVAHDAESAVSMAEAEPPEYAVVDLRMPGDSGLVLVRRLHAMDPATRIVVLTGYASISTAVEAVKLGATHYLAKPVDADEVIAAFHKAEGDDNISATARALNMHRRTLQRKLAKHAPRS